MTAPNVQPILEACPRCNYALGGLPFKHMCPECGFEYDKSMVIFGGPGFAAAVAEALIWLCICVMIAKWRLTLPAIVCIGLVLVMFVASLIKAVSARTFLVAISDEGIVIEKKRGRRVFLAWDQIGRIRHGDFSGLVVLEAHDGTTLRKLPGSLRHRGKGEMTFFECAREMRQRHVEAHRRDAFQATTHRTLG